MAKLVYKLINISSNLCCCIKNKERNPGLKKIGLTLKGPACFGVFGGYSYKISP